MLCCRSISSAEGEQLPQSELHAELKRKAKAITAIDASIEAARAQLANPRKEGEREVWETNVVILQVRFDSGKASYRCMQLQLLGLHSI